MEERGFVWIMNARDNRYIAANVYNEAHKVVIKEERRFLEVIKSQQGVFLVIFLLIGSILGFGVRGYMMKRVEGGW